MVCGPETGRGHARDMVPGVLRGRNPVRTGAEQYHGGTNGSIYLDDGDDLLSFALNMPQSGGNSLSGDGDAFGGEEGFDTVTLLNVDAGDVSTTSVTDELGRAGIALGTADGQLVELYGVDQLIFADEVSWML